MLRAKMCGAYLLTLLLLSLTISGSLVSCSSSEHDLILDEPTDIERIPVEFAGGLHSGWSDLTTRAGLDDYVDTHFQAGDAIGVFAYEIKNSGTDNEDIYPNVAYNVQLNMNTVGEWEKVKEVYWPNNKNSTVKFAAVYPFDYYSDGQYSKHQITVSDYEPGKPASIVIIPDGTVDLRIANETREYSKEEAITTGEKVKLEFEHILQKIVMTFKLEPDTESVNDYEYSGKVSYVIFKNTKRQYKYSIPSSTEDGWYEITPEQQEAGGGNKDLKIPITDVILDNNTNEKKAKQCAYLPPDIKIEDMGIEINGIVYPIEKIGNIPEMKAGNILNITLKINTIGTNVSCKISDWTIKEHDEDIIR